MSLAEYHSKRDFRKTAEPKGAVHRSEKAGLQFVIQKHAASHLHYDFRLELDGVLKSWAVPQGPCLDPARKRLAVQVEDHPLDYATFEGIIPSGEYGGGTVIVWDRGTWEPHGDPHVGLRSGQLKFDLDGEKLKGAWTLVRMRSKPNEKKANWLLIKERDDYVVPLHEGDIVRDAPASVIGGQTIDEMAADPAGTWHSRSAGTKSTAKNVSAKRRAVARTSSKSGKSSTSKSASRRKAFPEHLEPQLATLSTSVPDGPDWLHEIKLDGYRLLAYLRKGEVTLRSRNAKDWTHRFPELAASLAKLPADDAILDGEAVAMTAEGTTSFQLLQEALSAGETRGLCYYAFDLLWLNGRDLRSLPLFERKAELKTLVPDTSRGPILFSDDLDQGGTELLAHAKKLHLEGIVSKRRDKPYHSGRGTDWIKVKTSQQEEFVIGGFTDSPTARRGLGAILIGYHERGEFRYAGKVGTGFSEAVNASLQERLVARERTTSPFAGRVATGPRTNWVEPEVVAQIAFTNWTRDGRLRHPVFQGIREDKLGEGVIRDRPLAARRSAGPKTSEKKAVAEHRETSRTTSKPPATRAIGSRERQQLESIRLTHPERIVYPSEGITKRQLVEFYADIAEWILPHITDRPLSLLRCPEGEGGTCFFQKHASPGVPDAIGRVDIREKEKTERYLYVDSLPGLLSIMQMGVLEIHPWGSQRDQIERPDQLIFDLDPDSSVQWPRVIAAARELRERLEKLGLVSFVKTTGGKGLHVQVPLVRRAGTEWPEVKAFTKGIVVQMEKDSPQEYTISMRKVTRKNRIFLDYLRNDRGATAVAPYSTRARVGAPVATPLDWSELSRDIRSDHFHFGNLRDRLGRLRTDPWEEFGTVRQSITAKMKRQVGLSSSPES